MNASLSLAARATVIGALFAAAPLYAQTVVTPSNLNGWTLYDGSNPGTDPATITGAQPYNGNGSLQFTITAPSQSPSAAFSFAPVALSSLNSLSLGFSYLTPVGTVPASSPTIRLLLTGLTNTGRTDRSDGSLGWYGNSATGNWTPQSLSLSSGNFFFRVGGVGQAATDCKSTAGSFDDRRQTISAFEAACTGANGTINLSTASIIGVQVDFGSFTSTGSQSAYADAVNFSIGANSGNYNFETAATSVVPEPASLALMAFGMLAVGVVSRKRKQNA